MTVVVSQNMDIITPDMTVLDIISRHRQTEAVFKRYDARAGECICCNALFDPLETIAKRYGFNLSDLMTDLTTAIRSP
jgi:hypothetical protein